MSASKSSFQPSYENRLWIISTLFLAWLPFLNLGLDWSTQVISIQSSEFPIKVWSYVTFSAPSMWFGGYVNTASFPLTGALNNPDIVAGIAFWIASLLGFDHYTDYGLVFNVLLYAVMWLNIASGAFLASQWSVKRWEALVVGVFFAWQPLLISYGFASNITDLIHIWPFAFGLAFLKRAMEEENPETGKYAGGCFALGFLTCPYNFVLFISILPMLVWWVIRTDKNWKQLLWNLSVVVGILLTLYGLRVGYVMNQSTSLVGADAVESVRHSYPFDGLKGDKETRFAAFFTELWGVFPRPVVVMEQVARFTRHFQWGVTTWILVGIGLRYAKEIRLFALMGIVIGIGTCVGPFATWSPFHELSGPYNPIFWWSHLLPLGKMILEPFRYVLVSGVFMTVCVAVAFCWLSTRFNRALSLILGLMLLSEVVWRTPQLPLPVQPLPADSRMDSLPLDDGGVVHLPFFASRSNRFNRYHFFYQLQHKHPISDPIMGFPSPYIINNAVLCQLVHAETVIFPMEFFPCNRETIRKGWKELQTSGIGNIVLDPQKYAPEDWLSVEQIIQELPVQSVLYEGLIIVPVAAKSE